ncbi:MAG: hypothetical protein ABIH00_01555 [Armatimonadota bacterium]
MNASIIKITGQNSDFNSSPAKNGDELLKTFPRKQVSDFINRFAQKIEKDPECVKILDQIHKTRNLMGDLDKELTRLQGFRSIKKFKKYRLCKNRYNKCSDKFFQLCKNLTERTKTIYITELSHEERAFRNLMRQFTSLLVDYGISGVKDINWIFQYEIRQAAYVSKDNIGYRISKRLNRILDSSLKKICTDKKTGYLAMKFKLEAAIKKYYQPGINGSLERFDDFVKLGKKQIAAPKPDLPTGARAKSPLKPSTRTVPEKIRKVQGRKWYRLPRGLKRIIGI